MACVDAPLEREMVSMSKTDWGPRRTHWLLTGQAHPLNSRRVGQSRPILFERRSDDYDQGACPARGNAPRDRRLANVEAVLFVSREPIPSRKLAQLANLADATEARTLVGQLNSMYDRAGSSFHVEEVAGGYRLLTRSQFGAWLRKIYETPLETRLSAPALETLAVVAYRQPIVRAGIEAIRGVQCGEILRQLMDRDLVRMVGRSNEIGRPFVYGTTRRFLELFGLRSLEELPRAAELRRHEPPAN